MAAKQRSVEFTATIPPIMSAIKVGGDGGARLQFDVPDSDIDAVTQLLGLRGQLLKVTVRLEYEGQSTQ